MEGIISELLKLKSTKLYSTDCKQKSMSYKAYKIVFKINLINFFKIYYLILFNKSCWGFGVLGFWGFGVGG